MTPENLIPFFLAYGGNLLALLSMLVATALVFSRILFTFWAIIAIAFTLLQRGCNQGLHDIGRATGGGGGDAPPMVGIEFCVIVLWTSVLFALNVMFRKNLPNSMR